MNGAELLAAAKKRQSGQKKKSLPKRASRPQHKERRARLRAAQFARKAKRIAAQEAAHKRNAERGYTAWDLAKAARAAKRHGV